MNILKPLTALSLCLIAIPALATQTIVCTSQNDTFTRCDLSQADQRHVTIASVNSGGDCYASGAWGTDSKGIWVNHNCSAVFQYGAVASANTNTSYANNDNETNTPNIVIAPSIGTNPYYYQEPYYYGPDYYPGALVVFGNGGEHYYHDGHYYHNGYNHNGDGHYHSNDGYHHDGGGHYHSGGGTMHSGGGMHGHSGGGGHH